MRFTPTPLQGVYVIEMEPYRDHRGFFARSWCVEEVEQQGLVSTFVQQSISFNTARGTLRGLHYQAAPYGETKLVRCTAGAVYDVAVDMRPESPSYRQWVGVELTSQNLKLLYIPSGVAHGFQTLHDATELFYQVSVPYQPEYAQGVRWDDPSLQITWPVEYKILSERDQALPFLV